jgi:hypothetical protein
MTVSFNLEGYAVALQIDGENGAELLGKVNAVVKKLGEMGATPTKTATMPTNGNAPMCPTHNKPMLKSKHNGGYYCPVKVAESGGGADGSKPIYCKAKA